ESRSKLHHRGVPIVRHPARPRRPRAGPRAPARAHVRRAGAGEECPRSARAATPPPSAAWNEERRQSGGIEAHARVELAELAVARARLVVANLGDDALEVERVMREQRDAPLPVVEADRAGDDLVDAA